ncbi:synaptogenesis protein syg-2-like [Parasteatoda tepidariorum]|uniref:synaptogenesis protein syg-2-like n=1 Tax=Parasteatoda tepidariorum TaxID=114398 RepID=UPI0039BD4795
MQDTRKASCIEEMEECGVKTGHVTELYYFVTGGETGIKYKIDPTKNPFNEATENPEIHAVIGSTVSLPCNLTPPSPDDSFSLVLWYRLDLPNPIYTVDVRSVTAPGDAKHFSSKVLGTRARFNVSNQRPSLASLTLEKVREDDAGDYRCRVDFKRGRTLSWLVKLNVIVPTNSLVIKDKDNKTLSETIGPYKEGSSLTLICVAHGGHPLPSVTWWRSKSDLIDQSYEADETKELVRNEMIIESLKREDLLTEYTCQASNTNLTAPITNLVKLDISLNPTDVRINAPQSPISANERVEIMCVSKGSRPAAQISWWIDGKDLKRYATDEVEGDETRSKLFFTPTSDDNEKILTCRAENPENPQSALEDQWTLNVYYAPILSVSFGASQQHENIREGSDVYFDCNIQANPPATDIRWRFKSKPLLHNPSQGVILRNYTLLLQNVKRSQRGRYKCMASNLEGEGISEEINLRVQFAPVCVKDQKTTYGVARHEEANITCAVESDPPETAFKWSFNNSLSETIKILSFHNDGASKSVARYIPRTKLDYGALYCFAQNAAGTMKDPCVFTIMPTGPPEPVQNCSVTNQSANFLMLSCDAGDDGGLPQTFHLEVYSMSAEQLIMNMSVTETPVFVAEKLISSSSYILVLYSSNTKGRSTSVALTAHTLFSAEPRTSDTQPVTISAVLVVLMGTVGALVFLAILIILIMKSRGDRRGKNEEKTTEEKLPASSESVFDGKQTDIYTKNYQTEYVDLTPNARTERIYESLGDCKEYTYENVIHKPHYPSNQNAHNHHPLSTIVTR